MQISILLIQLIIVLTVSLDVSASQKPFVKPKDKKQTGTKENYENYKDIIAKAENLLIQKDKNQAIVILQMALKKEALNSGSYLELKKLLIEIGGLFLVEKAQQNYELAINLRKTEPQQAQVKILEANKIDPDNSKIISELMRQHILKKECTLAIEIGTNYLTKNEWDEEINLALSQAYICTKETSKLEEIIKKWIDPKGNDIKSEWIKIEIYDRLLRNDFLGAQEINKEIFSKNNEAMEVKIIEILIKKIQKEKNIVEEPMVVKYCENLSASVHRKNFRDVFFCQLSLLEYVFVK